MVQEDKKQQTQPQSQSPTQPKPKKKRWHFGCLGVVISLIFLVIIIAVISSGGGKEKANVTSHEVKRWTGMGIKTTEPFTIQGEKWAVIWSFGDTSGFGAGYLGISVKRPGGVIPISMAANAMGEKGSDASYIYEKGEFILDINSANAEWVIGVVDFY